MQEKSPCRAIFFVGCKSQVMFARSVAKAKKVAELYSAKKALHKRINRISTVVTSELVAEG